MRNRISAAMILGSTVILIGVLLLIRNLFNIDIPIFTIIISITLIWIGVMLIRGGQNVKSNEASTMFGESKMFYQKGKDSYKVMFGSGELNLQDLRPDQPLVISLECTFGEMKIIANREVPIQVRGSASFGSLIAPDMQTTSFGSRTFISPEFNSSQPGITFDARVTFGEMRFYYL